MFQFCEFYVYKKVGQNKFYLPIFCSCWILVPESEMESDPGWKKIRIQNPDKHPGSATPI
jgi:hypothetical protein